MSTFTEWQVANLAAEQLEECNNACLAEAARMAQLGGVDNGTDAPSFPNEEAKNQFINGKSATFNQYWSQYEASK